MARRRRAVVEVAEHDHSARTFSPPRRQRFHLNGARFRPANHAAKQQLGALPPAGFGLLRLGLAKVDVGAHQVCVDDAQRVAPGKGHVGPNETDAPRISGVVHAVPLHDGVAAVQAQVICLHTVRKFAADVAVRFGSAAHVLQCKHVDGQRLTGKFRHFAHGRRVVGPGSVTPVVHVPACYAERGCGLRRRARRANLHPAAHGGPKSRQYECAQ